MLNNPLGHHVRMQGDFVCAERLVPMPIPIYRNAGSEFPAVTIVTGGTKGLGMEYIKEVVSVKSSKDTVYLAYYQSYRHMQHKCDMYYYGLGGPAGFESSTCVLRSDVVSPRYSSKRRASAFCTTWRMLFYCPM